MQICRFLQRSMRSSLVCNRARGFRSPHVHRSQLSYENCQQREICLPKEIAVLLAAHSSSITRIEARVIYALSRSLSGPSVLRASFAFAKGKPPGPRPPAAALGDARLSQTLKGLAAREREVSPTPFIPTRWVVVRHSPCTP